MAKAYPLEIENCGEDVFILRSKGHHDPDEFMRAVRAAGYDWPMGYPVHTWHKTARCGPGWSEGIYVEVKPGTRGAYPVTECHEAAGERLYEVVRDGRLGAQAKANDREECCHASRSESLS